jgi:hypothetical protein
MSSVSEVRQRVGGWLDGTFNAVEVRPEEDPFDFLVPGVGSTAAFVHVMPFGDATLVVVTVPVLMNVRVNGELLQYIGLRSGDFHMGHLVLLGDGPEQHLVLQHAVFGEQLDQERLRVLVAVVASTGDEMDNDLQLRFGGQLFNG